MALLALFAFLSCLSTVLAQTNGTTNDGTRWVTYASPDGETVYLEDNRKPSLYTQNFGDCLGGSSINVTRFDAAYYQDNMTVLFHLAGNSGIANDSLMMYIGVYAYGEDRFDLVFNPCNANIYRCVGWEETMSSWNANNTAVFVPSTRAYPSPPVVLSLSHNRTSPTSRPSRSAFPTSKERPFCASSPTLHTKRLLATRPSLQMALPLASQSPLEASWESLPLWP